MVQRQEWFILRNQNVILRFLCTHCFIFGCAGSLLLHVGSFQLRQVGATLVAVHELLISVASLVKNRLWAPRLSCCELLALGHASVSQALEGADFSSCGAWAQLLHSMWDLPESGIGPMLPALTGRLLSIVPPGIPKFHFIY